MKIAFIVTTFPSLSQTFILNQITGLIDRGYEIDIFAANIGDTSKMHPDVTSYRLLDKTYYLPRISNNYFFRLLKGLGLLLTNFYQNPVILLRSLNIFKYGEQANSLTLLYLAIPFIAKQPYEIIHCHFGLSGVRGALIKMIDARQGKLITSFHGRDVSADPLEHGGNIYDRLFERGDLYTGGTTFIINKALALGCPQNKIIKLPVGVDLTKYHFYSRSLCPGESIKILTVARLVEKKGIEYSIRAISKLIENYPSLEYRIIGDGPLRESLEKLIAELGLVDKVLLSGWRTQDEVRQLHQDAHIFILSSVTASDGDQEGQGLVLQEAQAMGLPVLSTLHNGIPDGVLDGKSGFLVPERDVDALAEKLRYLIEHSEVWSQMGWAGRVHVEKHYDINKLNDQLVEIYQQLLT